MVGFIDYFENHPDDHSGSKRVLRASGVLEEEELGANAPAHRASNSEGISVLAPNNQIRGMKKALAPT
jgi:hypothetical protein